MAEHDGKQAIDPAAVSPEDAARLLTALGKWRVTVEMLEADIAAGAPTNADGRQAPDGVTINLVHYAAWLTREVARAD